MNRRPAEHSPPVVPREHHFCHHTALLEERREHLIQFSGQNLNTAELIAEASGNITQISQWCLELVQNDIFICQELSCNASGNFHAMEKLIYFVIWS